MHNDPVLTIVIAVVGLLLVAAVAAMGFRRLHLPFTVGLVVVGIAIGLSAERIEFLAPLHEVTLSPELILFVFLPTLIFESAYALDGRLLSQNLAPVLSLAVPGLLLSTGIVGALVFWLTPLGWGPALLFGALIAATDPVAVIALFKDVGAPKRLAILVEGESLFNDATAIVLFKILMGVVAAGTFGWTTVGVGAIDFVVVFAGGLLVGSAIGYIMVAALRFADDDPLVEVALSTVVAYAAFLLADHYLHVSGVMATVGAGIVVGTYGATRFTPEVKSYLHRFWDYAAFVANSLIFLLVGMSVSLELLWEYALPVCFTVVAVVLARAATVYGIVPIMGKLPGAEPIGMRYQTVLFWGGLKGAVALALALSLPADFTNRDLIVTLALGVVLFTLLVGGVTTGPLIRLLGLDNPSLVERMGKASALLAAKNKALARVDKLETGGHYSRQVLQQLRKDYDAQVAIAQQNLTAVRREAESKPQVMLQVLWSEAISVEWVTHREMFDRGAISEPVFRELELSLELQRDVLKRGGIPTAFPSTAPLEVRIEGWIIAVLQRFSPRSGFVERYRRRELAAKHEHFSAVLAASERVATEINRLAELSGVDPSVAQQCRTHFETRAREAIEQLDAIAQVFPEYVQAVQALTARRIALDAEADAVEQLAAVGGIPESVANSFRADAERANRKLARQPLSALKSRPEELLKRVPMFENVGANDFQRLVDTLVPRTVLAGEKIIQQGERGKSLFLIARGVVAVLVAHGTQSAHRVASLHAGDFFGEMALLTDEPRNATVKAATDCRLFELSRRDVEALCDVCDGVRTALEAAATERAGG